MPPAALIALDSRPVIVTWRSLAEGGDFSGSADEYRRLLDEAYAAGATVDVEHARGLLADPRRFPQRERVLVSHHSPFGLPADWEARVEAMLQAGARGGEARRRRGGHRRQASGSPTLQAGAAAIEGGRSSRWGPRARPAESLSALFGASLVYGPVERETAAGQVAIGDLLGIYEVHAASDDRGALRSHWRAARRVRCPPICTTRSFAPGTSRICICLCRCRTSIARSPTTIVFDPPLRGFAVTQPWKLAAARAGSGLGRRSPDRSLEHARARPGRLARREHGRRRRLRSARRSRDGRGPKRRRGRRRRRGASRGRGRPAPRLRGRRHGPTRRGGRPPRRGAARRLAGLVGPGRQRSGPLRQRDAGRLAPTTTRPRSRPASSRDGLSSSTASTGATAARPRRSARPARRSAPRSQGLQMFATQAVRQAQLFGVERRDRSTRSRRSCDKASPMNRRAAERRDFRSRAKPGGERPGRTDPSLRSASPPSCCSEDCAARAARRSSSRVSRAESRSRGTRSSGPTRRRASRCATAGLPSKPRRRLEALDGPPLSVARAARAPEHRS